MKQQTLEAVKQIVANNSDAANALDIQVLKLDVIRESVLKIVCDLDDAFASGAIQETGAASLLLNKIRDNIRLIDMAFSPLSKEIKEEVLKVNDYADELFDSIIKVD